MRKIGILLAMLMLSPLFFAGTCVSAGTSTGAYYDYVPADWRTKQARP